MPFEAWPSCIKCDYRSNDDHPDRISTEFCEGGGCYQLSAWPEHDQHLIRTCTRCEYSWAEKCSDG